MKKTKLDNAKYNFKIKNIWNWDEHRSCSICGLEIGRHYTEWDETHEEFCCCHGDNLP